MSPKRTAVLRVAWAIGAGVLVLGAVSSVLGQRAADEEQEPLLVRRARYVMGTLFEITAGGRTPEQAVQGIEAGFAAIRHADEVMSHYRPESDLMRLNRLGSRQEVEVPPVLYAVLEESIRYSELSGGAFDVTVGPLVRLWEETGEQGHRPRSDQLAESLRRVGFEKIQLLEGNRVRFARPGVEVNLGAIGKGWAVDRAVEVLRAHQVENAFVSAGTSTVLGLGDGPAGTGWRVEIVDPCHPERTLATVRLRNKALSTSASYERFREIEGRRYGHLIDPRSGEAVEPLASVSVVSPSASEADALSTAVYILGPEKGRSLLERLGREGLVVERSAEGECRIRRVNVSEKVQATLP